MSAAERASEASRAEQAKDLAMRANERTDEQVAQYLCLGSWLFWTTLDGRESIKGHKRGVPFDKLTHKNPLSQLFSERDSSRATLVRFP